jgi:hypothetical protein
MHQKQPPAKVAVSATGAGRTLSAATGGASVASDEGVQATRRRPAATAPRSREKEDRNTSDFIAGEGHPRESTKRTANFQ